MPKFDIETLETFIKTLLGIATAILVFIGVFNENVRGFLLNKLSLGKSKAEIKKNTNDANDSIIESMMSRITDLSDEFTRLSQLNIETQKENYDLKSRLQSLEFECDQMKKKIYLSCKNKCFDV